MRKEWTFEEKVDIWHRILVTASMMGEEEFIEFAAGDPVLLAKNKILWLHHAGQYFAVHISDGEQYDKYDTCREIADEVLRRAIGDVMAGEWTEEQKAELEAFETKCRGGDNDKSDVRNLFRMVFADVLDEDAYKDAEDRIVLAAMYIDHKLYSLEDERKDEVMAPYRSESDEPPPWLDEFEYIDWQITH